MVDGGRQRRRQRRVWNVLAIAAVLLATSGWWFLVRAPFETPQTRLVLISGPAHAGRPLSDPSDPGATSELSTTLEGLAAALGQTTVLPPRIELDSEARLTDWADRLARDPRVHESVVLAVLEADAIPDSPTLELQSRGSPGAPPGSRIRLSRLLDLLTRPRPRHLVLICDFRSQLRDFETAVQDFHLSGRIADELRSWGRSQSSGSTVWLLLPQSPGDTVPVVGPHDSTLFPTAVAVGLSGAADLDKDRNIDLQELSRFVSGRVSRWTSAATAGHGLQAPLLITTATRPSAESAGDIGTLRADEVCLLPVPRSGWLALTPKAAKAAVSDAVPPDSSLAADGQAETQELLRRSIEQWERQEQMSEIDKSAGMRMPHLWRAFEMRLRDAAARVNTEGRLPTAKQSALAEFLSPLESEKESYGNGTGDQAGVRLARQLASPRWPARADTSLALFKAARPDLAADLVEQLERLLQEETSEPFDVWWEQLDSTARLGEELLDLETLRESGVGWSLLRRILSLRVRECRLAVATLEIPQLIDHSLREAQRARRHAERRIRLTMNDSTGPVVTADLQAAERRLDQLESLVEAHHRGLRTLSRSGRALSGRLAFWAGCLTPGELEGPSAGDLEQYLELLRQLIPLVNRPHPSDQGSVIEVVSQIESIEARWAQFEPSQLVSRLEEQVPAWNQVDRAAMVASLLRTRILAGPHADQLNQWRRAVDGALRSELLSPTVTPPPYPPTSVSGCQDRPGVVARLVRGVARLELAALESLATAAGDVQGLRPRLEDIEREVSNLEAAREPTETWQPLLTAWQAWCQARKQCELALRDRPEHSPQALRSLIWLCPHTLEDLQDSRWDARVEQADNRAWNTWLSLQSQRLLDGLHISNLADQPWLSLAERYLSGRVGAGRFPHVRPQPGLELRPIQVPGSHSAPEAIVELFNPLSFPVQASLIIDHDPARVLVTRTEDPGVLLVSNLQQRALGWSLAEREMREATWLKQVVPEACWQLEPGERRLVTIAWQPLSRTAESSHLVLRLVSRPGQGGEPESLATRELSLAVDLPGELPFDLDLVHEPGETLIEEPRTIVCIPNQQFSQQAQLVNRGPARTCDVQVWSLMAPPPEPIPDQSFDSPGAASWLARLARGSMLGQVERQLIPARSVSSRLKFQPPVTPPPSGSGAAPGSGTLPELSIPGGLLFVIRDVDTGETVLRHQQLEVLHPDRIVRTRVAFSPQDELVTVELDRRHPTRAPWPLIIEAELTPAESSQPSRRFEATLAPGDGHVRMELPVRVTTQPWQLSLSVAGYPRAFHYILAPTQGAGEVPEETALASVRIVSPESEAAVGLPREQMPVRVRLDAPRGALSARDSFWEVGIDQDRNREFQEEPTLKFHTDRQVTAWFGGLTPAGGLLLQTRVEDFEIPLSLANQQDGRALLLARLRAAGREIWSRPIEVLFDGTGPRIREITAGVRGEAVLGDDLMITVRADDGDLSGVARLEAGFDLAGSGQLPVEPAPAILSMAEPGVWRGQLPTADLPEGTMTLLVRALDRVGNASPPARRVLVFKSAETIARQRAARRIEVRGRVRYFGTPVPEIPVVLRQVPDAPLEGGAPEPDAEPLEFSTLSDDKGEFRIPRVPPGKYTLQAKGVFRNKVREVSTPVRLDEDSDGTLEELKLP